MATIKIKQIKSKIGCSSRSEAYSRLSWSPKYLEVVEVEDTPSNRGMIRKVH